MAFDFTKPQATTDRLLTKFGQSVTLTKTVQGSYDPTTGNITNTTTTQTGTGTILDYGTQQAGIYSAPGSLIQMGDKQLMLSALKTDGAALTAPVNGDTVTDAAGKVWTITQVKAMAPAGTVVLYDCNLRV